MTRRDQRGDKRPVVARYHAFKDEVKLQRVVVPLSGAHVKFLIPMPPSWTDKKKMEMQDQPHQQRGDVDNFLKALLDAVYLDDKEVWDIRVTKVWSERGAIVIT
jgi:Holliday junction resolvase RusA-like endonuclease